MLGGTSGIDTQGSKYDSSLAPLVFFHKVLSLWSLSFSIC